jgi:hypothetical protein
MSIQDSASNALLVPDAVGQMIGWQEPPAEQEVLHLDMYNFLINPIRQADATTGPKGGNLFVKRYLSGPQVVWDQLQRTIFATRDIWDVTRIEDRLLKYLKNIVGWTDEPYLKAITDRLTDTQLRKLIATAVPLWKSRGREEAYEQILSVVTDARMRVWNWFDLRWILDETILGEDHQGRDPWLLPSAAEHESDVRIVDDGNEDRALLLAMLALFRPGGERLNVYWISFLDRFLTNGDNTQWSSDTTDPLEVEDRILSLSDDTIEETAEVSVDGSSEWANLIAYWRLRGTGTRWGGTFYRTDEDNHYSLDLLHNPSEEGILWSPDMETLLDSISGITGTADGTTHDPAYNARSFNGATDRLDWANITDLCSSPLPFTFTCWLLPDTVAAGLPNIFTMHTTAPLQASIFRRTAAALQFSHGYSVTGLLHQSAAGVLTAGVYQHVGVTYTGSELAADALLYHSGTEVASYVTTTNPVGTPRAGNGAWSLGGRVEADGNNINGDIRLPKVWNRVLTPEEMLQEALGSWGQLIRLLAKKGGVETVLASAPVVLAPSVYNGLRVHVQEVPTGTQIRAYLDGDEMINFTDTSSPLTAGTIGIRHAERATVDLSEAEVFQLPLEHDIIDINEHL